MASTARAGTVTWSPNRCDSMNPTGNEDMTRIRNCETLRNGCESLRRHHWAVCEAARNRRETAAKPAKVPRNPRKRRESAAKKLRIRVISSLPDLCTGIMRSYIRTGTMAYWGYDRVGRTCVCVCVRELRPRDYCFRGQRGCSAARTGGRHCANSAGLVDRLALSLGSPPHPEGRYPSP